MSHKGSYNRMARESVDSAEAATTDRMYLLTLMNGPANTSIPSVMPAVGATCDCHFSVCFVSGGVLSNEDPGRRESEGRTALAEDEFTAVQICTGALLVIESPVDAILKRR